MFAAGANLANFAAATVHCSYAAGGLPLIGNHGPIRVMTDSHPVLLRLAAHWSKTNPGIRQDVLIKIRRTIASVTGVVRER
jgi:hypothetical protein